VVTAAAKRFAKGGLFDHKGRKPTAKIRCIALKNSLKYIDRIEKFQQRFDFYPIEKAK